MHTRYVPKQTMNSIVWTATLIERKSILIYEINSEVMVHIIVMYCDQPALYTEDIHREACLYIVKDYTTLTTHPTFIQ